MIASIDTSLIDWSRAQFALTAMYHWIFVPLTLGLAVVMGIMETAYYKTGNVFWKNAARFWMKLFGINFAVGVATGLILEFQFGTNWSNYSWFVGDIFGAPLAIEGIIAFFMEATFIAVMFFGWNKVSKGFHLASTWLTGLGATISAWWILVANAWMQDPVGMEFNPDTVRNEMVSFAQVALSPSAVNKFFHTVLSGWVLGAVFVVGISAWYLLKNRNKEFAVKSMKIGAIFGIVSSLLIVFTGHTSGTNVAKTQPMKLAAVEGLYVGSENAGISTIGILNCSKESYNDNVDPFLFDIKIPGMLSFLATNNFNSFVPGIKDIIEGGYTTYDGSIALSAEEKMQRGKLAIQSLANYRAAKKANDVEAAEFYRQKLKDNEKYFGYGYITNVEELIPNVPINFYSFRLMVGLGFYFILFFVIVVFLAFKKDIANIRWINWVALFTIPLGYIASQAGWVVAEVGRQPWAIQDMLPLNAAISKLNVGSVQTTFMIFLVIFTVMLIAMIGIMRKAIGKGPEELSK